MFAIGYLSRRAFWHNFCDFSIQTQYFRESIIFACVLSRGFARFWKVHAQITVRASKRPLALKCLNWQTLHEFSLSTDTDPGDDGINAHIPAYTRIEQEWMVCPLIFFSFIDVVVMYWEDRMCFHQQKHTLAEPCLFHVLFITNHIADALSDLSWTAVLARADLCGEPDGSFFFCVPCHP